MDGTDGTRYALLRMISARPRLRGVSHTYAFYVSWLGVAALAALAATPRARMVAAVYGPTLPALFGVSALFHRVTWSIDARRWMGRLDHAMINLHIAAVYTPFGVLALSGSTARSLLPLIWAGAIAGILLHTLWLDAPKWLSAALYVGLGWIGFAALPELIVRAGWGPVSLLIAGGVLYSIGAAVYAVRRPDPIPAVFGYHEVFHALVVGGAFLHFVAVTLVLQHV